ncbi:hypothetical protein J2W51_004356 [Tardiphaga robiniae]|jgi:hypothetical protein|uniref:hypothetical protein n=1 Tax=Tardiphaga robiniae TaxID=943830 RepID=UPI00285A4E7D|nr:hypothetical protein [Tardiphaga robiniae]MDR6661770.1 hypothetical protein [Tardiphaga robiniae]
MPHPPLLAVAIAGALALATAVETYHAAHQPKPDTSRNTAATVTPAQQLDRALQALRLDTVRDNASAM